MKIKWAPRTMMGAQVATVVLKILMNSHSQVSLINYKQYWCSLIKVTVGKLWP